MNRPRRMRAFGGAGVVVALSSIGFPFACGDSKSAGDLAARDTSWLVRCSASSQCAIGACLCGVCTEPCAAAGDCSAAPSGARCFEAGSVAQAAVCGGTTAPGLCLPACSASDDCGAGNVCALGACLPAAALPDSGAPGAATSEAYGEVFPTSWVGVTLPRGQQPSGTCDDPARCPTLEALLRSNACFEVQRGCGVTYLNGHDGFDAPERHYWYDGFGEPPLVRYENRSGELLGTGSVACDAVEAACWTCDAVPPPRSAPLGVVLCSDVPSIWPAPPPEPDAVPGCACEPDGGSGARVSLDCFCSSYECPRAGELLAGCASAGAEPPALEPPRIEQATLDPSGQLWLWSARFSGQRYAFDVSGAMVGAEAFSQGPVTAPCNTRSVSAGIAPPSATSDACSCSVGPPPCADAAWFPAR